MQVWGRQYISNIISTVIAIILSFHYKFVSYMYMTFVHQGDDNCIFNLNAHTIISSGY